MRKIFAFVVALVALFSVACENSNTEKGDAISITSPTEVTIGKYSTEFVVTYKANAKAEVETTADWLHISGHKDGQFTVATTDNETGGTRMAAITLSNGDSRASVVVNQLGEALAATLVITNGESIDIERAGCKVVIEYTLENSNPEDYVYVKSDAKWIYSKDTQTNGKIELGVATNTSGKDRETVVTVGYGATTATTTLRQKGSGEMVFNAPILTGSYLGDVLTPGAGNYWFFLTDRGFDMEGDSLANTTYYRIDAYGPVSTDIDTIKIPNGVYNYDPENSCAAWTFTAEYSGFWVTDENARRQEITPFEEGTLTVKDNEITLTVKVNGETHTVVYNGNTTIRDERGEVKVYSTLTEDYATDLSDHYLLYDCYGDYYDYGAYNWMLLIAPYSGAGDCIQFDFITGYNDEESGFFGDYVSSDYLAKWSFIPGWSNQQQLNCSWYFTADQSKVAPFRGGDMSIKDNGDGTITVEFEVLDDRRNTITGSWTGVGERYEE
jgi:hypothetical protein